jgi:hypothetical protein
VITREGSCMHTCNNIFAHRERVVRGITADGKVRRLEGGAPSEKFADDGWMLFNALR